ncbi:MAG: hypothetical protein HYY16_05450 [Planctomycetes bacterium]|nr:hypothetical protein [Planctomycetota bacterium]
MSCPVCRARFRQSRECPRCGADLGPLMTLAVAGHDLRRRAREALRAGDVERGRALAEAAQRLHSTPAGRRLCAVLKVAGVTA